MEELEKKVQSVDFSDSHCGIGHTRWATHGEPSDVNSHPHSGGRRVTIVHNGIIENYLELKEELASKRSLSGITDRHGNRRHAD